MKICNQASYRRLKQKTDLERRKLKNKVRTGQKKDFPAIICACEAPYKNCITEIGYSGKPNTFRISGKVFLALCNVGIIGEPTPFCGYILGACAEPHAAEKIIYRTPWVDVGDLYFGIAIAPRTGLPKKACANCKRTFPNL